MNIEVRAEGPCVTVVTSDEETGDEVTTVLAPHEALDLILMLERACDIACVDMDRIMAEVDAVKGMH